MSKALRIVISAVAFMAANTGFAGTLKTGGTGDALGSMAQLGTAFEERHPDTQVEVLPSLGSGGGINALRPAEETDTQLSATNDQANAETLQDLPGSVGLVALGQTTAEQRQLKVLTLEVDQDFDPETSFAKTLHLVSAEETIPIADEFIAFVFSAEGRDLLSADDDAPVQ